MTGLILTSMGVSRVFMFPLIAQPLSLGLSIIISSLFLCTLTALTLSSWYAYILFLIYVGGLLGIFAYVAALSPNVLFRGGGPLLFFVSTFILLLALLYTSPFPDLTILSSVENAATTKTLKRYGSQLVSEGSAFILIGLGLILLINLVAVVKICYYQHASLRPFSRD